MTQHPTNDLQRERVKAKRKERERERGDVINYFMMNFKGGYIFTCKYLYHVNEVFFVDVG